ncbi:DNA-directed RNA polymerase subunit M [Tubulinosema ratisbonensis]|uniref:DNA-directed RNA polymerase subunit n=1 Tax=Tubulinosema ratisbonensis TaxID=291195 RepID=A0A437AK70_9MICR|nr:DNA-directed RNA polymerase subunit M [Tubulinosema ratisbonensis]
MHFCPDCDNMLVMEKIDLTYSYCCNTCSYKKELVIALKHTVEYQPREEDKIWYEEDENKNLDYCEKLCECGETRVSFFQMQTRSADEPMTIFYKCVKCKNTWRE